MESPKPERIGLRKQLAVLENAITAGHPQFGHLPVYVQEIEGWTFRRCRCGFTLALTPRGTIVWLKITKPAVEVKNFKLLLCALNSNCLVHPRPEPLKVAVTPVEASAVAAVQETDIGTKIVEPLISKEAASTPHQPLSSRTQNDAKPTSKQVTPGMPEVEKPRPMKERVDKSPIKRRRVYFPETTGGKNRERPRPFGR